MYRVGGLGDVRYKRYMCCISIIYTVSSIAESTRKLYAKPATTNSPPIILAKGIVLSVIQSIIIPVKICPINKNLENGKSF